MICSFFAKVGFTFLVFLFLVVWVFWFKWCPFMVEFHRQNTSSESFLLSKGILHRILKIVRWLLLHIVANRVYKILKWLYVIIFMHLLYVRLLHFLSVLLRSCMNQNLNIFQYIHPIDEQKICNPGMM